MPDHRDLRPVGRLLDLATEQLSDGNSYRIILYLVNIGNWLLTGSLGYIYVWYVDTSIPIQAIKGPPSCRKATSSDSKASKSPYQRCTNNKTHADLAYQNRQELHIKWFQEGQAYAIEVPISASEHSCTELIDGYMHYKGCGRWVN